MEQTKQHEATPDRTNWLQGAKDVWIQAGLVPPAQVRRIHRVYHVVLPLFCALGALTAISFVQRDPLAAAAWSYQVVVTLTGSLLLHAYAGRAHRIMQGVFVLLIPGFLVRLVLAVSQAAGPELNLLNVTAPLAAGAVVMHTVFTGDVALRVNKGLATLATLVAVATLFARDAIEVEQALSVLRFAACAFGMALLTEFMSDLQHEHTKLQSEHAAMERLALSDALTGLGNRRACEALLDRETARAERHGSPLSVILLDVDKFKAINDTQGHEAGDKALKGVARLLREQVRASDELARWAGDEFMVVLPATPLDGATVVAERLRAAVAQNLASTGVTVSLGVGSLDARQEDLSNLLGRVDRALYRAKAAGRNRAAMASQNRREPSRSASHGTLALA